MSAEDQKFYQPQFTTEIQMLAQQKQAKLRSTMTFGTYKGESAEVVKQIGQVDGQYGDEAGGDDTPDNDIPKDQRWVFPAEANVGKLFKRADAMRILADPSAQERQAMIAGMNRTEDRKVIMPAFFGTAKTGKGGATNTAFPNDGSQDVAITVGSADGMTSVGVNTAKLIAARTILSLNDVDLDDEEIWVAMDGIGLGNMLSDIKATNRDYAGDAQEPVLKNGKLSYWMGFNFVEINGIPRNPADATESWIPLYCKSGMHLGVWEELQAFEGPDAGKKFNRRIYFEQLKGATRLDEKKVVRIKAKRAL